MAQHRLVTDAVSAAPTHFIAVPRHDTEDSTRQHRTQLTWGFKPENFGGAFAPGVLAVAMEAGGVGWFFCDSRYCRSRSGSCCISENRMSMQHTTCRTHAVGSLITASTELTMDGVAEYSAEKKPTRTCCRTSRAALHSSCSSRKPSRRRPVASIVDPVTILDRSDGESGYRTLPGDVGLLL